MPFLQLDPAAYSLSPALTGDIQKLVRLLGEVLRKQDDEGLLGLAQRLVAHQGDSLDPAEFPELGDAVTFRQIARAFTVLFQLINLAEQKEIVRVNRSRHPRRESIDDAVRQLKESGVTSDEILDLLGRIAITPTLTAHPTEAKRKAVLDKLHTITRSLASNNQTDLSSRLDEHDSGEREAFRQLLTLWQTDEMRARRLSVSEEIRNALYFFDRSILDVVPWLHEDLEEAFDRHYPGVKLPEKPIVEFRSWVGGDRDGNPYVTPEVTWEALVAHRKLILEHYLSMATDLRREITQSVKLVEVDDALTASVEVDKASLPYTEEQLTRYSQEPYVQKMLGIELKLGAMIRGEGQPYPSPNELLVELEMVATSLQNHRAEALATSGKLRHLIRQVQAFGFHLATLDVRQHSDEHEKALTEILSLARVTEQPYDLLTEDEKVALLSKELLTPRPFLHPASALSAETTKTLEVFRVILRAQFELSPAAVRAYIMSMTRGLSDIYEVLLLCREAGLLRWNSDGQPVCDLDIVPLFETIDDLHQAGGLMRDLFALPFYHSILQSRGGTQEIMLGYSDSSKDGGYFAANWALQSTLVDLAALSENTGVPIRLFHGRGGTTGRGGGRANRAILSQPSGSFCGQIRFTEQGEVISFRYSLPPIAHRHLEQIVGAVLLATKGTGALGAEQLYGTEMRQMEEVSRAKYRALVYGDPDFMSFYTQATPILHISLLPIASRPVSRAGQTLANIESLRAIPWNFAWVQSRFTVVGWYGLGAALESVEAQPGGAEKLQTMYQTWPFFQTVIDNAQLELVRCDLATSRLYAQNVVPTELGTRILAQIQDEYDRTVQAILRLTQQQMLLGGTSVVRRTVEFRNPLVLPLNKLQVHLMKQWGQRGDDGVWREAMLQTIAGIAAAMQSTG